MNKNKKFIILSAITAIIVLVSIIVTHKEAPIKGEEVRQGRFLKDLQGNVDNVKTVVFKQNGHQLKVKFIDGTWTLPGKYNYPIEVEKIRDVVANAEKLEILEKKTDDKTRLGALGLGDPDAADSKTPRVVFMDAAEDKVYADFIRGNEKMIGKLAGQNELYVRNFNEDQSWTVTGDFPIKLDADALLNKKVYAIEADRMKKASFKRAKGKSFDLAKADAKADFKLTNPPKTAKDGNVLNDMGNILSKGLVLADVAPRVLKPFDAKSADGIIFETFDGLTITLQMFNSDGGNWIVISAEGVDESKKTESDAINSIAKDWVYKLSGTASDLLSKDFDSL